MTVPHAFHDWRCTSVCRGIPFSALLETHGSHYRSWDYADSDEADETVGFRLSAPSAPSARPKSMEIYAPDGFVFKGGQSFEFLPNDCRATYRFHSSWPEYDLGFRLSAPSLPLPPRSMATLPIVRGCPRPELPRLCRSSYRAHFYYREQGIRSLGFRLSAPSLPSPPLSPGSMTTDHRLRGGSWSSVPRFCRSVCPNRRNSEKRERLFGLRLSAPSTPSAPFTLSSPSPLRKFLTTIALTIFFRSLWTTMASMFPSAKNGCEQCSAKLWLN